MIILFPVCPPKITSFITGILRFKKSFCSITKKSFLFSKIFIFFLLTSILGIFCLCFAQADSTPETTPPILIDRTNGGPEGDMASCVVQTSDGGYARTGTTASYGAGMTDFWLSWK